MVCPIPNDVQAMSITESVLILLFPQPAQLIISFSNRFPVPAPE